MPAVCFYITGHGFGHASRQIEIINALRALGAPDLRILIRTSAPAWLFDRTVASPRSRSSTGPCDTGIVQIDSLRLDAAATVAQAAAFYARCGAGGGRGAGACASTTCDLVIADAPPLAAPRRRRRHSVHRGQQLHLGLDL